MHEGVAVPIDPEALNSSLGTTAGTEPQSVKGKKRSASRSVRCQFRPNPSVTEPGKTLSDTRYMQMSECYSAEISRQRPHLIAIKSVSFSTLSL